MTKKTSPLRPFLLHRFYEITLLIVLSITTVLLYGFAVEARRSLAEEQQRVQAHPNTILLIANIRSDLRTHAHDIHRIFSHVGHLDDIADIISDIEVAASSNNIEVEIPDIQEEKGIDTKGQEVAPSGPHKNIVLKITATGSPTDLLEFLHQVEHVPRLIAATEWELRTETVRPSGFTAQPESTSPDGTIPSSPPAVLSAEFTVSVVNE